MMESSSCGPLGREPTARPAAAGASLVDGFGLSVALGRRRMALDGPETYEVGGGGANNPG